MTASTRASSLPSPRLLPVLTRARPFPFPLPDRYQFQLAALTYMSGMIGQPSQPPLSPRAGAPALPSSPPPAPKKESTDPDDPDDDDADTEAAAAPCCLDAKLEVAAQAEALLSRLGFKTVDELDAKQTEAKKQFLVSLGPLVEKLTVHETIYMDDCFHLGMQPVSGLVCTELFENLKKLKSSVVLEEADMRLLFPERFTSSAQEAREELHKTKRDAADAAAKAKAKAKKRGPPSSSCGAEEKQKKKKKKAIESHVMKKANAFASRLGSLTGHTPEVSVVMLEADDVLASLR